MRITCACRPVDHPVLPDRPTVVPTPVQVNGDGIAVLHKRLEGRDWLLAANELKATVRAEIAGLFAGDMVHVLFEDRSVPVRAGVFTDTFEPNAVHVYAATAELPPPLVPPPVGPPPEGATLADKIRDRLSLAAYQGRAAWIWYPGLSATAESQCWLRREVM